MYNLLGDQLFDIVWWRDCIVDEWSVDLIAVFMPSLMWLNMSIGISGCGHAGSVDASLVLVAGVDVGRSVHSMLGLGILHEHRYILPVEL